MEKTFNPHQCQKHWIQTWEQKGYSQASGQGNPYSIALPPPNVTGSLHMGHGFQQTLMDVLIRLHRMQGDNTHWQVGTDHAGISTQMVVERLLAKEGITRHDLGRDAFVEKVWEWKEKSGGRICQQIRELGASIDWSRERFSMDEGLTDAVKDAFIKLHKEGLIYRGKRLVNWDPKFHTAISDLEVINKEKQGSMWHMRYPLADGSGHLIVATTRPETMLGDSAVAVHPDDERYQHLIGKMIRLPLVNRDIPIIADDYVDPEFGSGCVKITPAHDFNDNEVGKRHNLPLINIMTIDAHLNDDVPAAYRGLERFAARKQIVADLEAQELMEKIEPHTLQVPYGDRSDVVIEPMLTDQWFIRMAPLAEPAKQALHNGDIKFTPENWGKTYMQWLDNIQDWCISRQIWWGHRIPAWYDNEGNVYVGKDEASIRHEQQLPDQLELKQDTDVLDTWFSASLWPFATLGWPEQTSELSTFYPTSTLVTGFDIIFFWVARMVMMGIKFMGQVPFKDIYIHGLIRDSQGNKMSKSKGNVLDPLDLIDGIELEPLVNKRTQAMMQPHLAEKIAKQTRKEFPDGIPAFGADALRFTFCALASTGRNINFDLGRIEGYRNFCNKIWNAARFVLQNVEDFQLSSKRDYNLCDQWIQTQLQNCINQVLSHYQTFRFDLAANCIYDFIWNQYCDWYLEFAKVTLYSDHSTAAQKAGTQFTLVNVLEQALRLLHPMMPFITEEIWQSLKPLLEISSDSIMLQSYPQYADSDDTHQADIAWLQAVISAIRTVRAELNVAPSKNVPIIVHNASEQDHQRLAQFAPIINTLCRLESCSSQHTGALPLSANALVDGMELHIPLKGIIDVASELKRIEKEIAKTEAELARINKKLANTNYVQKAPAEVVDKERQKALDQQHALTQLLEHKQRIAELV